MDFKVFDETELQDIFSDILDNLNESQKQVFMDKYGSVDAWKKHFVESTSNEKNTGKFC